MGNKKKLIVASVANFFVTMAGASAFMVSPRIMMDLQASSKDVGYNEAIVESLSLICRVISGYLSDSLRNRKIFILISYMIGTIGKYMLISASSISIVTHARAIDRIGNGLAACPRDALIGSISNDKNAGMFFGIKYFLQYSGSVVAALLIYYCFDSIRNILIYTSIIPMILGMLCISTLKEEHIRKQKVKYSIINALSSISLPFILTLIFIFFLKSGYYSGAFYYQILHDQGLKKSANAVVMIVQNASTMLFSILMTYYADKYPKKYLLVIGTLALSISHYILYISQSVILSMIGIFLYGVQIGITHNLVSAFITITSNKEYLGFNFSIANIVMAISVYCSNTILGISLHNGFFILFLLSIVAIIFAFFLQER